MFEVHRKQNEKLIEARVFAIANWNITPDPSPSNGEGKQNFCGIEYDESARGWWGFCHQAREQQGQLHCLVIVEARVELRSIIAR